MTLLLKILVVVAIVTLVLACVNLVMSAFTFVRLHLWAKDKEVNVEVLE
jgi:hypothetical protein